MKVSLHYRDNTQRCNAYYSLLSPIQGSTPKWLTMQGANRAIRRNIDRITSNFKHFEMAHIAVILPIYFQRTIQRWPSSQVSFSWSTLTVCQMPCLYHQMHSSPKLSPLPHGRNSCKEICILELTFVFCFSNTLKVILNSEHPEVWSIHVGFLIEKLTMLSVDL